MLKETVAHAHYNFLTFVSFGISLSSQAISDFDTPDRHTSSNGFVMEKLHFVTVS